MKVVVIKPRTDTKGGDMVVSRLGFARKVDLLVSEHQNIYEEIGKWNMKYGKVDCVLVDEVQFLKSYHMDQLFEVAVKMDIPTICYGLRTDFLMNGFEGSQRLLLIAHSIEELKTICNCGKKAILNGRKINGKFVFEGEQIAIDSENDVEYHSLCPKCYFQFKDEYLKDKK